MTNKRVFISQKDLKGKNLSKRFQKLKYVYAYKIATDRGNPPYYADDVPDGFYAVGYNYTEEDYNPSVFNQCGSGLNVATFKWCIDGSQSLSRHLYEEGSDRYKLFIVRIKPNNVICIPDDNHGKFRVREFDILREVSRKEMLKHPLAQKTAAGYGY